MWKLPYNEIVGVCFSPPTFSQVQSLKKRENNLDLWQPVVCSQIIWYRCLYTHLSSGNDMLLFFFFSNVSLCTIITPALCVHSCFKLALRVSASAHKLLLSVSLLPIQPLIRRWLSAESGFSQSLTESWRRPGGRGKGRSEHFLNPAFTLDLSTPVVAPILTFFPPSVFCVATGNSNVWVEKKIL